MVRPAYPGEVRIQRQVLTPASPAITLSPNLTEGLLPSSTEVTLQISPQPPINLRQAVKGLLTYPYGCLEQTVSRAYPLLHVDEEKAKRLKLKPLSRQERIQRLQKAFSRLAGMQHNRGGFGLWSTRSAEEPWLTPYVLDFLLDAREAGFEIPTQMLQKGLNRLHKRLRPSRSQAGIKDYIKHNRFASNAYAAYILARVGRAPLGTLRVIHDQERQAALSGLPLIHLGLALRLQGDHRRAALALAEGVAKERLDASYSGHYLSDYGSPQRDTALIIWLLARHQVPVDGAEKLIFRLSQELAGKTWWSTQERFALFMAGDMLAANHTIPWQGSLKMGDHEQSLTSKSDLMLDITPESLHAGVVFNSTSDIPLYINIETSGYGQQPPVAKEDVVEVSRSLLDMDGQPVEERALQSGELLIAHLLVKSLESMQHGLVVDLLPAGLEIENLALSQGETMDNFTIDGINPTAAMNRANIHHVEYRDDRFVAAVKLVRGRKTHLFYLIRVVSPGTFHTPSPLVEDMYHPDRYGIGVLAKPTQIEVRP